MDVVSKQNRNVKIEMQPKNMGELQSTGRSKLLRSMHTCRQSRARQHRSTGAAGTTLRPREVVGPPIEVVARPTLTPRDQTSSLYLVLRTNFQPHSRGHHAEIISNSFRFGSDAGKQRPENVGVVVVRLLAFTGDLCGCVAVLAVGCELCTAVLL